MEINGKIEKEILKRIFRDHWEGFKKAYSLYDTEYYNQVVGKMLLCGEKEGGYATYGCECGEERTVAFSCKSSFCLSCSKVYVDEWVEHIGKHLHEGIYYRHVVLTVPEDTRAYFYKEKEKELLGAFMRCGIEMLDDAVKTFKKKALKMGYIVVLQMSGRASNWNPHLHIIMTAGGIDEKRKEWVPIKYFPFELLHKKWQYHLLKMLKKEVKEKATINMVVDKLWKQYPDGLVAYWEKGDVPRNAKGLARYLAKYVVSPPIAVRRIEKYDGQTVKYWYIDHKTKQKEETTVSVYTFMGRMVQTILPKGFQRIRYYGLQATCVFKKVKIQLQEITGHVGEEIRGAYQVVRKSFRQRVIENFNKDPFMCPKCGGMMKLMKMWHPDYGNILVPT